MRILTSIALLSFCTGSASALAAEPETPDNNEVIEDVVVKGVNRCGSWPIQHERLRGCEYAVLKKEQLQSVLILRQEFFETCLICQGNRCIGKVWQDFRRKEKVLCKDLFWTPTRITKNVMSDRDSLLRVSFTFKISTKGRVEDIEVVSLKGDIAEAEILRLIRDGARRTRFEPLVIADTVYEIVGIRDEFVLNE